MAMGQRRKRIVTRFLLLLAASLGVGLAFDGFLIFGHGRIPLAAMIAIAALASAGAIYAGKPLMSALDERQRNMRYATWYWGGLFGLMFGTMTAAAISLHELVGVHRPHPSPSPASWAGISEGAMLVCSCQVVGYYVARLVWLRNNRVPAS